MRLIRFTAPLALAGMLVACGSDGGDDPSADQATADAAIDSLQDVLTDKGFAADPDPDDDDDGEDFTSDECKEFSDAFPGDDDHLPGETATAELPTQERGDLETDGFTESVEAQVGLVGDEDDLDELFDDVRDERFPGCVEEAFRAGADDDASSAELTDLQVETDDLDVGDDAIAVHITGTVTSAGIGFPFASDLALARMGRQAATAAITTLGEGTPSVTIEDLVDPLLAEAS